MSQADKRSKQSRSRQEATQHARNVRPVVSLQNWYQIAAATDRTVRAWVTRRHLPSRPSVQNRGPARPARPGHRTEGKAREGSHSLACLSQTSQPPALWKQHRRPTLSAPCPLTCQLGPALPFVTLINCPAAQLSRSRFHGKHQHGYYHDVRPGSILPRRRETLEAVLKNPGAPSLASPSKATPGRLLPGSREIRRQTPRTHQTY